MNKILQGDSLELLKTLDAESVDCVITSPPYFGLRDYGMAEQIGLESTPEQFVEKLVDVFREIRRVLKDDGTVWVNLGDSYAGSWGNYSGQNRGEGRQRTITKGSKVNNPAYKDSHQWRPPTSNNHPVIKAKDLMGIPWRVAFALQTDGWYLRQDIIWAKPNPMPESVTDRCTKAHEYIFLLSKSPRYYFDADAIKTPWVNRPNDIRRSIEGSPKYNGKHKDGYNGNTTDGGVIGDARKGANKRSVWTVNTAPFKGAHFAVFPESLIEPMVLAGCPRGGGWCWIHSLARGPPQSWP